MNRVSQQNDYAKLIQLGLLLVACISIVFAILHAFFPNRLDEKTAMFLGVAVVSLVIHQITKFKGLGIEFEKQVEQLKEDVKSVESRQDTTESEVRALQVAVKGLVTQYEFDKLLGLDSDGPFNVQYSHRMYDELRRLITLQYVRTTAGPITELHRLRERNGSDKPFDLKQYVAITDEGREYVRLRRALAAAQHPAAEQRDEGERG